MPTDDGGFLLSIHPPPHPLCTPKNLQRLKGNLLTVLLINAEMPVKQNQNKTKPRLHDYIYVTALLPEINIIQTFTILYTTYITRKNKQWHHTKKQATRFVFISSNVSWIYEWKRVHMYITCYSKCHNQYSLWKALASLYCHYGWSIIVSIQSSKIYGVV